MWLGVSTVIAVVSGWFRLMARFPDQPEEPLLRITRQAGVMGAGARMNGILSLSVCPSGLRVGIMRIFGPFCRDFFVPWDAISMTRKTSWSRPVADLQFGIPATGSLTIAAPVANRLANAALGRWPESGSLPEETRASIGRRLLMQWALVTSAVAVLVIVSTRLNAPAGTRPPIQVILFVAVVSGAAAIVSYVRQKK
jgi:hypothetical protein